MKKWWVALFLGCMAMTQVQAGVGIRGNLSGASGYSAIVIGLNNINLFLGNVSTGAAIGNQNGVGNLWGAAYYFSKPGDLKYGLMLYYTRVVANTFANGTNQTGTNTLNLGIDFNQEIAKGLSLGATAVIVQNINNETTGSNLTNYGSVVTQVYVQLML